MSDAERRFNAEGRPDPVEFGLGFADPGVCVLRKIID